VPNFAPATLVRDFAASQKGSDEAAGPRICSAAGESPCIAAPGEEEGAGLGADETEGRCVGKQRVAGDGRRGSGPTKHSGGSPLEVVSLGVVDHWGFRTRENTDCLTTLWEVSGCITTIATKKCRKSYEKKLKKRQECWWGSPTVLASERIVVLRLASCTSCEVVGCQQPQRTHPPRRACP